MTDREKLVEILGEFLLWPSKMKDVWMPKGIEKLADHLIAHGVTVQEWISVTERLPEEDVHVLCRYNFGEYSKMAFYQVLDYYAYDPHPHFQHEGAGEMRVTHWMPMPEPPKGE